MLPGNCRSSDAGAGVDKETFSVAGVGRFCYLK
jgi:hypothetical protein